MQADGALPEARPEPVEELRGEADLGNEDEGRPAPADRLPGKPEVDLGLAAPGHSVEEGDRKFLRLDIGADRLEGPPLGGGQLRGGRKGRPPGRPLARPLGRGSALPDILLLADPALFRQGGAGGPRPGRGALQVAEQGPPLRTPGQRLQRGGLPGGFFAERRSLFRVRSPQKADEPRPAGAAHLPGEPLRQPGPGQALQLRAGAPPVGGGEGGRPPGPPAQGAEKA